MWILTMIFAATVGSVQGGVTFASIAVEYESSATCNSAKDTNRESLRMGNVVLATCTKK